MDYGVPVDLTSKLMKIDSEHKVYISRRSLKHFVESRKKEMVDTHSSQEIFERLYFAIDNVILTYMTYDEIQVKSLTRLIYTKHYVDSSKHSLRVVLDTFFDRLEICSIHFRKRKTPP